MNISEGVVDMIARTADATVAASGAVGGAAVNGVIGGVRGAAVGVKNGMSSGSHSAPAAALALGAVGVTGLVDWPVLVGVGGAVLLAQRLGQRSGRLPPPTASSRDQNADSRSDGARAAQPGGDARKPVSKNASRKRSPSRS